MARTRQLAMIGVVLAPLLISCSGPTKRVALLLTDSENGRPLAMARLRAAPLETNQLPLPVTLRRLQEARKELKVSATTDDRGRAMLRLYRRSPSLIEVTLIDFEDESLDAPAPTWIYDPSDGSIEMVTTYGTPSDRGARVRLKRRR